LVREPTNLFVAPIEIGTHANELTAQPFAFGRHQSLGLLSFGCFGTQLQYFLSETLPSDRTGQP
jgi:hypothetical protein